MRARLGEKLENCGRKEGSNMAMPVFGRTASTSFMEHAAIRGPSVLSLMAQEENERRAQLKSRSVAWKEPMLLLQRMGSRKGSRTRSIRQRDGQELQHHSRPSNSRWARFWRKLRLDGVGRKVHAARPEWLNYDSHSYAMNFEKDPETPHAVANKMPKISGPGAREIVNALLQRNPSTNRNSGSTLIPKPVADAKVETNAAPLWKRRSVQAPSSLNVNLRAPSSTKRRPAAVA